MRQTEIQQAALASAPEQLPAPEDVSARSEAHTFVSAGPIPAVGSEGAAVRSPTASERGYVTEADVPGNASAFARFVVNHNLSRDSLRSIARAMGANVDCGDARSVELIGAEVFRGAEQTGMAHQLPELVTHELTTGSVSEADTMLHPTGPATMDEVPTDQKQFRNFFANRLSEDELTAASKLAGLFDAVGAQGGTDIRMVKLLRAATQRGTLEELRAALLETYNMKVREADHPAPLGAHFDVPERSLITNLFDAFTLEGLHAVAKRAGVDPSMIESHHRRLLFAARLVDHCTRSALLDALRAAAEAERGSAAPAGVTASSADPR